MVKTYRLLICGYIEWSSYRHFILHVANALGYVGTAKSLPAREVEVMVSVEHEEELEFFISKLYEGCFFFQDSTH